MPGNDKKVTWLFETGSYYWSFDSVTYATQTYTAKVLENGFAINLRHNIGGNLIAKSEASFSVGNADGSLTGVDFIGDDVIIRLLLDGVLTRSWKFKVRSTSDAYGVVSFACVDILQDKLNGDFPTTPSPKTVWPSEDTDPGDDYCIPVVLGAAYIPVRSVNTGADRYYILGASGPTYTVDEVSSPHNWGSSSTWLSSEYTMAQSAQGSYRGLQPEIHNVGGTYYPGLWKSGDTFLDMLCKYSRSDTAGRTDPSDWLDYVLQSMGVASGDIDAATFTAAGTAFYSRGLVFNGGFWEKEARENIISSLLAQCDAFFTFGTAIELRPFSKTSVETFTDVLEGSFSPAHITTSESDGGVVKWQHSGSPQDVLSGQAQVGIYAAQASVNDPDSTEFEARFVADSQDAQTAGSLYFQKKHAKQRELSFSVGLASITHIDILSPGMVVSLNNALYGGSSTPILTGMSFSEEAVRFSGVTMAHLEDWGDYSPGAVSVGSADAVTFSPDTTESGWSCDVEFTSSAYNQVSWAAGGKIYNQEYPSGQAIDAGGPVTLTTTTFIYWDPDTPTVFNSTEDPTAVIGVGNIVVAVLSPTDTDQSESDVQVFGGATGGLVYADKIVANVLSAINANIGEITAGVLRNAADTFSIDLDNAEIRIDGEDGMVVDADGGVRLKDSSSIIFETTDLVDEEVFKIRSLWYGGTNSRLEIKPLTDENGTLALGTDPLQFENIYAYASNKIFFRITSTKHLTLEEAQFSCDNDLVVKGDLKPDSADTYDVGKFSENWENGHFNSVYASNLFLGGTGASHNLGDYETGEYNPTLVPGSGTITLDTDYNTLAYTKIGRKVTITGELKASSVSSPSGTLQLSLPYTIDSDLSDYAQLFVGSVAYQNLNALGAAGALTVYGWSGNICKFMEMTTTGGTESCADHIQANSILYLTLTYFAMSDDTDESFIFEDGDAFAFEDADTLIFE